jgi:hypothetical protein
VSVRGFFRYVLDLMLHVVPCPYSWHDGHLESDRCRRCAAEQRLTAHRRARREKAEKLELPPARLL